MEPMPPQAHPCYREILAVAGPVVVGLDFDGTLAPIVADPTAARIHPDAAEALTELAGQVAAIAVVTGRPVRQVLELGGLEELADRFGPTGARLLVLGQYGNERWSSTERTVVAPDPPAGLAAFRADLAGVLDTFADADQAYVEDKGLAVAVHTRRMTDPAAAYDALLPPLEEAARAHDLEVEPGRFVIEVRAGGIDKGDAVRALVAELEPAGLVFAGDDLGDVPAFEAVRGLREQDDGPVTGLLVCSSSTEQTALADLADVVVDGPDGVVVFLARLAADRARR